MRMRTHEVPRKQTTRSRKQMERGKPGGPKHRMTRKLARDPMKFPKLMRITSSMDTNRHQPRSKPSHRNTADFTTSHTSSPNKRSRNSEAGMLKSKRSRNAAAPETRKSPRWVPQINGRRRDPRHSRETADL